jgi:hypothetical protein
MYISLADSRANGFVRWAAAFQPEKLGDAKMVSISKFTRKLANHKNVSANFS